MMMVMIRGCKLHWVLSFRDKPKIKQVSLQTSNQTLAPLRAIAGANSPAGSGEDAADAAAQAFCTIVASFRNTKS